MGDTTSNRAYRKPLSTDGASGLTDYWRNLADDVDADVAEIVGDYLTSVKDTSVGSIIGSFTLSSAVVRTLMDGKLVFFQLTVTLTAAITATAGAFTDVPCFTLDAAYRPSATVNAVVGGLNTGEAVLSATGVVSIRSSSDTITSGTTILTNFFYIVD